MVRIRVRASVVDADAPPCMALVDAAADVAALKREIADSYRKLNPDLPPLDIVHVCDEDGCAVPEDYRVGDVFDDRALVKVVVRARRKEGTSGALKREREVDAQEYTGNNNVHDHGSDTAPLVAAAAAPQPQKKKQKIEHTDRPPTATAAVPTPMQQPKKKKQKTAEDEAAAVTIGIDAQTQTATAAPANPAPVASTPKRPADAVNSVKPAVVPPATNGKADKHATAPIAAKQPAAPPAAFVPAKQSAAPATATSDKKSSPAVAVKEKPGKTEEPVVVAATPNVTSSTPSRPVNVKPAKPTASAPVVVSKPKPPVVAVPPPSKPAPASSSGSSDDDDESDNDSEQPEPNGRGDDHTHDGDASDDTNDDEDDASDDEEQAPSIPTLKQLQLAIPKPYHANAADAAKMLLSNGTKKGQVAAIARVQQSHGLSSLESSDADSDMDDSGGHAKARRNVSQGLLDLIADAPKLAVPRQAPSASGSPSSPLIVAGDGKRPLRQQSLASKSPLSRLRMRSPVLSPNIDPSFKRTPRADSPRRPRKQLSEGELRMLQEKPISELVNNDSLWSDDE